MRLHYVQHVPFEDSAHIKEWAKAKGYQVKRTMLSKGEPLPRLESFDWLTILGGPMSTCDEAHYPWLVQEKHFIKEAIDHGKMVLGVCLGAQLVAELLGATVATNDVKEIGWLPVELTTAGRASVFFKGFPASFTPMHWHSDCFDLPTGAVQIACSPGCVNQAFVYGERVLGIQFHLEFSMQSLRRLVDNCGYQLVDGPYIQQAKEILDAKRVATANQLMDQLFDNIEAQLV